MYTVAIDVSRNWPDDRIPAKLILKSKTKLAPNDALSRFRRAVSQWLANTIAGRDAWDESVHNFNYGDFIMHDVGSNKEFFGFLHANGLFTATVERFSAEDCGETWDSTIKPEE